MKDGLDRSCVLLHSHYDSSQWVASLCASAPDGQEAKQFSRSASTLPETAANDSAAGRGWGVPRGWGRARSGYWRAGDWEWAADQTESALTKPEVSKRGRESERESKDKYTEFGNTVCSGSGPAVRSSSRPALPQKPSLPSSELGQTDPADGLQVRKRCSCRIHGIYFLLSRLRCCPLSRSEEAREQRGKKWRPRPSASSIPHSRGQICFLKSQHRRSNFNI